MSRIIAFFIDLLKYHKIKLIFFFLSFFVSLVLLFPYRELGLFLQSKINESIKPNFVKIGKVDVSFFPYLSLSMEKIDLNISGQPLFLKSINIHPHILSLFLLKPSLDLVLRDLFKGNQKITLRYLNKENYKFHGLFQLELSEILRAFNKPQFVTGRIKGVFKGVFQPTSSSFKDSHLIVSTKSAQDITFMGSLLVNHWFAGVNLPSISFSDLEILFYINSPKMILKDLKIGIPKDNVFVRARGEFKGDFQSSKLSYKSQWLLKVKPSFASQLFFLTFLDKYKKRSAKELSYQFEIIGENLKAPPQLKHLSRF